MKYVQKTVSSITIYSKSQLTAFLHKNTDINYINIVFHTIHEYEIRNAN